MGVWNVIFASQMDVKSRIDSDYFLLKYVANESKLDEIETKKLTEVFSVSDGNHLEVSRHFSDDNEMIPYYRGKDINDFFIENANPIRIPSHIYNMGIMKRSHFKAGDVLLSIVGTIGSLSVVPDTLGDSTGSCKIAILRKKGAYSPFLLAAFLLSKYGQSQIKRNTRGAVQMGLILKDFVNIRVPLFNDDIITEIESIVMKAIEKNSLSKSFYSQAQNILEKELGLGELVLEKPKSYETNFSEIVSSGRTDADHYQVQYKQTKDLIKNYRNGHQPLLQIVDALSPNYNPHKSPTVSFRYVELSNINPSLGMIEGCKIVDGMSAPSRAKRKVLTGDIIASTVVGSIDKAGIVDQTMEGALASTGFFHFRTKGASPYYLLLLVRSKIIKMQLLQEATGGILSAVPDQKLKNVIVPTVPASLQIHLHSLVYDSHQAKKESEILLEKAKKRIEDLIEGGI